MTSDEILRLFVRKTTAIADALQANINSLCDKDILELARACSELRRRKLDRRHMDALSMLSSIGLVHMLSRRFGVAGDERG